MTVDKFDISDEERERRKDEAELTFRLILSVSAAAEGNLSQEELDRLLDV